MFWQAVRNLVRRSREHRWSADFFFIPVNVYVALWVGTDHHFVRGLVACVALWGVREVCYHFLVRRKRAAHLDAA